MSSRKLRRPSYLMYCLFAVILFGSYVMLNDLLGDSSATVAPNLMLGR